MESISLRDDHDDKSGRNDGDGCNFKLEIRRYYQLGKNYGRVRGGIPAGYDHLYYRTEHACIRKG